jgi:prophage regulatory protein
MYNPKIESYLRLPQIIGDRKRGIAPLIPVSRSTWLEGVKKGIYPKPVYFSPRTMGWSASSIEDLMKRLSEGERP